MNDKTNVSLDPVVSFNPYKAWPMIVAAVVVIIWLARLEARVNNNDESFGQYKTAREKEISDINLNLKTVINKLDDARIGISNIEGRLGVERVNGNTK